MTAGGRDCFGAFALHNDKAKVKSFAFWSVILIFDL
jgi:hypothetical protein